LFLFLVFLRSILELRKGQKTKTFKKHKSPSVDTLYFLSLSIIYGIKQHSIDVAFKTDPEFDQWIFALLHFAKESKRGEVKYKYIFFCFSYFDIFFFLFFFCLLQKD